MRTDSRQCSALKSGVLDCCARARALEQDGHYEAATELLSEWWGGVGERPNLEGLSEAEAAAVQLRISILTGWLGSARQVKGSQELALDLLFECAGTFERLGEVESLSEAQLGIALIYWRKASYDEARVFVGFVLDKPHAGEEQMLCAIVMQTMVERSAKKFEEAARLHEAAAPRFERKDVPARLKAIFYFGWARTHRTLGNMDEALLKFDVARKYLEEIGDVSRLAIAEQALGFHYYKVGSFDKALDHTERAITLYESTNNIRGVAEAKETLSRVRVELKDYQGAERAARDAVDTLRAGEEKGLFVEALTSLGTALARQEKRAEAYATFGEAEEVAANYIGQAAVATVVKKVLKELCAPACLDAGMTMEEPVHLLEKETIREALERYGGLKKASMKLRVEYNTLRKIIERRHPDLRLHRSRIVPRKRGVIKRDSSKVRNISDGRRKR